jgi:hypothetical protein
VGPWRPLFNGKDLTGWTPHAKLPGNWRVENGILIGSAAAGGSLYTTRNDFRDFRLRMEIRLKKGDAMVFFRAESPPLSAKSLGYLVHIKQQGTGTLEVRSRISNSTTAHNIPKAPPDWFTLEILAQGDLVAVEVNGKTTAKGKFGSQLGRSGHIALFHSANSEIEFRNLEIKE